MKNGIEFEPRCQVIGHEIESVDVATYSKNTVLMSWRT